MKVLVTGGAGFLGSYFVKAHVAAGDEVTTLDDWSASRFQSVNEFEQWAGAHRIWVSDAISIFERDRNDFDLAYHFAAPVGGRLKIEGDPLFNAHSLGIDEVFFRWAVDHCKNVVYPSSSAVYGIWFQREITNKDRQNDFKENPALNEFMFQPGAWAWEAPDQMYGFTKLAGEYLAWKAAEYGVNTLCIRPFSGYGEGQSFDYPIPSIAARALRKENPLTIWGSGNQTRDFIHVDDLVRLTRLAAGQGSGYRTLNLGSGVATTFFEIALLFAELVGYEPLIVSDETKPEGVYKRFADIGRQQALSTDPLIPLRDGLARVLTDVEQRLPVAVG